MMAKWRTSIATWVAERTLTHGSRNNHTYARRPANAQPDFYALWAEGSPLEPTPSSLYFSTQDGRVYRLPAKMTGATAKPELLP